MKNLFKLFGIIALVAVIGFSFAACDTDPNEKTIWFSAQTNHDSFRNETFYYINFTSAFGGMTDEMIPAYNALTKDDIVFTPADVATLDEITKFTSQIELTTTVLKSGTVTVSIKDKDGYEFVLESGSDQITFTK